VQLRHRLPGVALEWVRQNITGFGGDPTNVTVVGESAGAMSVGTLLGLPTARGLFRRAVALSGAAHHNPSTKSAGRVAERVLELAGITPGDRQSLTELPVGRLVAAAQQVALMEADHLLRDEHPGVRTVFAPVIDSSVLPNRAYDLVTAGASDDVDVLLSTCADEYRVFLWGMPEPLRALIPTPNVASYFPEGTPDVETVLATYAASRPAAGERDLASAVAGDAVFGIPAVRLAEAKAARGDRVWVQQLAWRTPVMNGQLGACHALDLPFLFAKLDDAGFLGANPPTELAHDLHGACVRFAATGDPNGGRLPRWEQYNSTTRPVMRFDVEPQLEHDPGAPERRLWSGVW
jgi:para-nitrobenzyl esterase